ncbi:MAG: hypothetical protein KF821_07885 [Anaerolineales bacterium]|nr:hypothetical protein [Anaerolineales bacterium]
MGISPVNETIQVAEMSDSLRNRLWNVIYTFVFNEGHVGFKGMDIRTVSIKFYHSFLKLPVDHVPSNPVAQLEFFRNFFFTSAWHGVYDFIEWLISKDLMSTDAIEILEDVLVSEFSGYRIIDGNFLPITSPEEISTIQAAIDQTEIPGASTHLTRAIELLSDKEKPDYRNSIKESISAVESAAQKLANLPKATLGDAIKLIEQKHRIHPALKDGLLKIYGYTSNEEGVRHAMQDSPDLRQEDALLLLVMCSAFVNYLSAKSKQS